MLDALELCIPELHVMDGQQDQLGCQAPCEANAMPDTDDLHWTLDTTPRGQDAQGTPQAVEAIQDMHSSCRATYGRFMFSQRALALATFHPVSHCSHLCDCETSLSAKNAGTHPTSLPQVLLHLLPLSNILPLGGGGASIEIEWPQTSADKPIAKLPLAVIVVAALRAGPTIGGASGPTAPPATGIIVVLALWHSGQIHDPVEGPHRSVLGLLRDVPRNRGWQTRHLPRHLVQHSAVAFLSSTICPSGHLYLDHAPVHCLQRPWCTRGHPHSHWMHRTCTDLNSDSPTLCRPAPTTRRHQVPIAIAVRNPCSVVWSSVASVGLRGSWQFQL